MSEATVGRSESGYGEGMDRRRWDRRDTGGSNSLSTDANFEREERGEGQSEDKKQSQKIRENSEAIQ